MPVHALVEQFGGPEQFVLKTFETQPLSAGQLRIAIKAIGVNRADVLMRTGAYHVKTLPLVPGLEAAGRITESKSKKYNVGDRVVVLRKTMNLYASEAVVGDTEVTAIPQGISDEIAASLPVNWLSAYHCLFRLLELKAGQTLLITASASAVGQAAIQLAKMAGANVIGAVGSEPKAQMLEKAFGIQAIFAATPDSLPSLVEKKCPNGIDAVLELVGGKLFRPALLTLRAGGRLAQAANVTLEDSVINVRDFYPKNIAIYGFQYGNLMALRRDHYDQDLEVIFEGFKSGKFRSLVSKTFPLSQAAKAHEVLVDRAHSGKIILVPEEAGS